MKNEKTFVDIQPCECNVECGQYILYIHGDQTHIRDTPPELIDVATLSVFDLVELEEIINNLLEIQVKKEELEWEVCIVRLICITIF